MLLELCSLDYVPYHDDIYPFPRKILTRVVRSVGIVIVPLVLIRDQCDVGKELFDRLRAMAVGTPCGKILRSFYQSCNNEARHSQVNNGGEAPYNPM